MKPRSAVLLVATSLVACKNEHAVFEQTHTDSWVQSPTDQVDILFVVDNSHSMQEEQAAVAYGFETFITEIVGSATDFHLGVITTSFEYDDPNRGLLIGTPTYLTSADPNYADTFRARVLVGTTGADKEKGLEAAEYALSPAIALGYNAGFLRNEAYLLVIWVSDENDCSDEGALSEMDGTACYSETGLLAPVSGYVQSFRALKEDAAMVRVGTIVGPLATDGSCPDATPGLRYMEFAAQLGGLVGDICDADYSDIMARLGLVASGVVESFELSYAAQPDTLEVWIIDADENEYQVFESAVDGWTYDTETHYLTFHGTAIPPRGSAISAKYTIQAGG